MKEFDEIQKLFSKRNISISDQYPVYVQGDDGSPSLKIPHIEMGNIRLEGYSISDYEFYLEKSIEAFIDKLEKEKFFHTEYPIKFPNVKKSIKAWKAENILNPIENYTLTYSKIKDLSKINDPLAEIEIEKKEITQDKLLPIALDEINNFIALKVELCDRLINEINKLTGIKPYQKKTKKANSFNYKGSFDNLKSFYESLISPHDNKGAFIDEIEYMEFRKIFTDNEVTTKINWLGQKNELHFLIDAFHDNKRFENIAQRWSLTQKCFSIKNTAINIGQLKDSDDPPQKRYHELDRIVKLLF